MMCQCQIRHAKTTSPMNVIEMSGQWQTYQFRHGPACLLKYFLNALVSDLFKSLDLLTQLGLVLHVSLLFFNLPGRECFHEFGAYAVKGLPSVFELIPAPS